MKIVRAGAPKKKPRMKGRESVERSRASGAAAGAAGYSKRSRLDKLGVKSAMRVALVGLEDGAFLRELQGRTSDIAVGTPRKGTEMILFAVDGPAPLQRLDTLRHAIVSNGAIWVVWPKGQPHIKEDMIRNAAIAHGLVDIKVIAFSETLSGLKLVIPVAKR
jgi:hypothetical protein